jgi:flagellar biosynthesis regulator FlaF
MLPIVDGPATDLDHLHLTLRPEPLVEPEEFKKYYRPEVNQVRGEDTVARLSRKLQQAYQTLKDKTGKEWILVVEDLDKTGIGPQQLQELFIQYGNVFQDLRVNLIFTIPVWLAYSSEAVRRRRANDETDCSFGRQSPGFVCVGAGRGRRGSRRKFKRHGDRA